MRDLLGGKGANVAEMTRVLGADRVPAGFTITTEACVAYMEAGGEESPTARGAGRRGARRASRSRRASGSATPTTRCSSRSAAGARESMPGMLDTVLNLGLNDESVEGLARTTGNERFAWDSYRRFVQMFGNVCRGDPGRALRGAIEERKREARGGGRHRARGGRPEGADRRASRSSIDDQTGEEFPQDPRSSCARRSARCSTRGRASERSSYRRINHIPDEWGTAVNVQQMVFGNSGDESCSGVAFSRDEVTGEPEPSRRLPAQRAGRGRGLRSAHPARPPRDEGLDARRVRRADGDPAHARAPLRGHAGHRVHRRGGLALHAPDAQRQAPGAGGGALRRRRGGGGPARQGRRAAHDRRRSGSTRCCTRPFAADAKFER